MTPPTVDELTDSQRRVLQAVKDLNRTLGYPPSRREIADATGFRSTSTIDLHVKTLKKVGLLRIVEKGQARGVVPVGVGS